jgi:hypothetical protein
MDDMGTKPSEDPDAGHLGHAYSLLRILQHYAPDGPAQEACSRLLHEMQAEGASGRYLDMMLAGMLLDGLRDGNWPWAASASGSAFRCAFEGCLAYFDPALAGTSDGEGGGVNTGWRWPSADGDACVEAHDHEMQGTRRHELRSMLTEDDRAGWACTCGTEGTVVRSFPREDLERKATRHHATHAMSKS